jgi:(2Fe-2S) ferredoxin
MKIDKDGYDLHVLVCTNEKKNEKGCGPKGGQDIVDALKEWSKSGAIEKGKIRINKSGCLGRCEEGIVCVAYPKGEWVVDASKHDIKDIQKWILSMVKEKE